MSASKPASSAEITLWIDQFGPRLLPVARAFASGSDEAEDILQEVWIIAAHKSRLRPPGTPIRTWLYTVTLNVGRSMARTRQRRANLLGLWHRSANEADAEGEPTCISDELNRLRLWREVARLPGLQRKVVLLRIIEGMSTREAAQALGRSEGTVQASLSRATGRLRSAMEEASSSEQGDDRKAG